MHGTHHSKSQSNTDLKDWLVTQKQAFIAAFRSQNLQVWVICMGNEAGDLDTLASSIGLAYFASIASSGHKKYIPLQLTPSSSFHLRSENLEALRRAGISYDQDLLCSDMLDGQQGLRSLTGMGAEYGLVDHNSLLPIFGSGSVVHVIDHHEATSTYESYTKAEPSIVRTPIGSCASLVTEYYNSRLKDSFTVPQGVADLLLSAILIDTACLKRTEKGGKTTPTDVLARDILVAHSSFHSSSRITSNPSHATQTLGEYFDTLKILKMDVSRLNSRELLERDYKEYTSTKGWKYGLSTVPLGLKEWIARPQADSILGWEGLFKALEDFAAVRELDAVAILTSFRGAPKKLTRKQGQHKRQVVLLIRQKPLESIFHGLPKDKGQEELRLEPWKVDIPEASTNRTARVWRMKNANATRKQFAPRMARLVDSCPEKPRTADV